VLLEAGYLQLLKKLRHSLSLLCIVLFLAVQHFVTVPCLAFWCHMDYATYVSCTLKTVVAYDSFPLLCHL